MAPGSQAPTDVPAGRSGGKILKTRRTSARKTPYDRPTPPQPEPPLPQSESPSWLGGLVMPAKFVAGGASKIFSSFWNPKTWATASSSSSDSDSESEDDSGDDENPSDELIGLNQQQKGNSSQKTEILHLVEQLLMLERYSREERDRLIEIINSRVLDCEGVDAGPSMIHSKINNETPDAIMEARKWVAENKVRSDKKSDLENGFYALKYIMTSQATEEEPGSPVEVAKSYMKTRPPWESPLNRDKSLTPSPLVADLFKERTPYSSELAKRDYLSGGPWNIHDEIRRLRSKATEDMLNSHRSMKITSSLLDHDSSKHSLPNEKSENPFETPKVVDLTGEDDDTPDLKTKENEDDEREEQQDDQENKKTASDLEKNCYMMTESAEIPNSQDSSNTNLAGDQPLAAVVDGGTENQAVVATRATRNTRRGKGRGGK